MNYKNKSILKLFFIFLSFSIILSISYIIIEKTLLSQNTQETILHNGIKKSLEREGVVKEFINNARNRLFAIRELEVFEEYLENGTNEDTVNNIFLTITKSNPSFMKLRYIDKEGMEKIRLERDNEADNVYIVSKDKLQNQSSESFFINAKTKELENVSFSSFYLYNNKATIRAFLPLSKDEKFNGMLIIDYFMDKFLKKLTNAPIYDMIIYDNDGLAIYHYDSAKSWKFNIKDEFPTDYKAILDSKFIKTDHYLSRKFDVGIDNGLSVLLQLRQKYKDENLKNQTQYYIISFIIFLFSLILFMIILKIYSKTLLNLDELKELDIKNKVALKTSEIGIWEWDIKSNKVVFDDKLYEIYELDKSIQITYDLWISFIDKECVLDVERTLQNSLKSGEEFHLIFTIKTLNKDKKYIKSYGLAELDDNNKVIKMIGTNQNITSYKLSEHKYKTILDLASDSIFIMDYEGNLIDYSKNTAKALGYSDEEMKNLTVYDWDKEITKEDFQNLAELLDNDMIKIERVHTRKNGTTYIAQIVSTKIAFHNKSLIYASARDITELKKQQEELKDKNYQLEQKNRELQESEYEIKVINENLEDMVKEKVQEIREKEQLLIQQSKLASMGEMIGNIAHQWRQPLNVIAIKKEVLLDEYYDNELDDTKIEEFNISIDNTLQYMSKTIDDFRNFFAPSKEKSDFFLVDSINSIVNMLNLQLKHNQIDIQITNHYDKKIVLNGFANEFKQVIINLINNAKDAITKRLKNKEIENGYIKIDIYFDENTKEIKLQFCDNGGGIPDDILAKIFEPYFTTKFQAQGTGLGLYMSKIIIEKNMQGKLNVKNVDNGAMFEMILIQNNI